MTKKKILMQPNNMVKSRYNCTPVENKIFYEILFNAQKQYKDLPLYIAEIKIDTFREILKNNNDATEKKISNILLTLHKTILEFDYMDEEKGEIVSYKSGLIGESKFFNESRIYEINIPEIIYKSITDFIKMQSKGNGYLSLNFELFSQFKGFYTQRFYTFFRLWSRENKEVEIKYSLNQLREYLYLKSDTYLEYKYFKQKIIKRALHEINEIGNMRVSIKKEIKKGRKVDEIVFSVIDYEPRKYFEEKETKKILEVIEIPDTRKKIVVKEEKKNFYIPDRSLFTTGTLRNFKIDFANIDFTNLYMERAFNDAIMITLDRDEVEKIKATSYKFFKSTLDNKIVEYRKEEIEDIEHKRNIEMFW